MDLNDIVVFARVAGERSFSRAARSLELPKSTVSERVARLEKTLGVRLFDRTTRSLRLTESGSDYLERVRPLVDGLEDASAAVTEAHRAPRGVLRVGAPLLVGQWFLADLVAEFLVRYPDIEVELVLQENASSFDLVHDRLDLALHVFGPLDPSHIVRKVGVSERLCVASPAYLRERGTPSEPADLGKHACVVIGAVRKTIWPFGRKDGRGARRSPSTIEVPISGRYAVTSIDLVSRAVLRGIGIGALPTFLIADALTRGDLVRVLPGWSMADAVIQVVYASGRQLSARTRAFADLLIERSVEKIASMPWYDSLPIPPA